MPSIDPILTEGHKPEETVASILFNQAVLKRDYQKLLPCLERKPTPVSDHLFDILRRPLRDFIPGDTVYDETFDFFEYLLCLVHCDVQVTRAGLAESKYKDPNFTLWASIGRFGWKESYSAGIQQRLQCRKGELYPEIVGSLLRAGFFESGGQLHEDKYTAVKDALDRHVANVRAQWMQ